MNRSIIITGVIGVLPIFAELSFPIGASCFFIMADGFFQGQYVKYLDGWQACLNRNAFLQSEDIQILVDTWEQQFGKLDEE